MIKSLRHLTFHIIVFSLSIPSAIAQHNYSNYITRVDLSPIIGSDLLKEHHKIGDRFKLSIPPFDQEQFELERISMYSQQMRSDGLALANYRITSTSSNLNGFLLTSPLGLFVTLYNDGQLISIRPSEADPKIYLLEYGSSESFECGNSAISHLEQEIEELQKIDLIQNGSFQRVYRLAAVTTGEYYTANGGTTTDAMTWLNFAVNGISTIFQNELGVRFSMPVDPIIYSNAATDPFTPDNDPEADGRTTQARTVIGGLFNITSYDIGHVFHNTDQGGNWSGGGVANRPAVCRDFAAPAPIKAGGWSGSFNNQNNSFIALAAHEFGHMFGANHSFNGEGSNCDDAISPVAAYEIGSGTTIMSYNGICQDDNNIPSGGTADDYFHVHSLVEMISHMTSEGDCHSDNDFGNSFPSSNANPCNISYTIPLRTPFLVTGEGSDPDGDDITYCWEQYDEDGDDSPTQGFLGNTAGNRVNTPLFRSYPPTPSPVRYFPKYDDIISGTQDPFEVLPRVNRDITLRLTVRDNHPESGGIAIDETIVRAGPGGPLVVDNPNSLTAGEPFDLVWDPNGSDDLCDKVDIYLSIDGGSSFNIPLALNVDYADGDSSADEMLEIIMPAGVPTTNEARLMVKCVDNPCTQFFSISSSDRSISSTCEIQGSIICDTDPLNVMMGDPQLDIDESFLVGREVNSLNSTVNSSDDFINVVRESLDGNCEVFSSYRTDVVFFSVTESGIYSIEELNNIYSIYNADTYLESNPCLSYLGVNIAAVENNPGSVSVANTINVNLDKCTRYRLHGSSFSGSSVALDYTFSGPGKVFLESESDENYSYTFVAENQVSNSILGVSDTGDFTSLPGGDYRIYGMIYKSGGPEPPANVNPQLWLGLSVNEILGDGLCGLSSANFKTVTIEGGCSVFDVQISNLEECIPDDNYSALVNVYYANTPENGNLIVENASLGIFESVPLTVSPQTVILTNLDANGQIVDLNISVPEDINCAIVSDISFQAPAKQAVIDTVTTIMPSTCLASDGILTVEMVNSGDFTYVLSSPSMPNVENSSGVFDNLPVGFYQVEVNTNGACIADYGQLIILEGQNNLTINAPNNITGCDGNVDPITVLTNTGDQFVWTEITNSLDTLNETDTYSPTISGTYQVIVSDSSSGCTQSTIIAVELEVSPTTNLPQDSTICQFSQMVLQADPIVNGIGVFEWKLNGTTITGASTNEILISEPGMYTLSVTNLAGCVALDTFVLDLNAAPSFFLGEDQAACQSETVILDVSSQIIIEDPTYQWFGPAGIITGETSSSLTITDVLGSGTYSLEVTNSLTSCSFSDEVEIEFVTQPEVIIEDTMTTLCEGNSTTIVSSSNFSTINWTLDGDTIIDVTDYFVTVTTGGELIASAGSGSCIARDTIQVELRPAPLVFFASDAINGCMGDIITLDANNEEASFNWLIGDITLANDVEDEFDVGVSGTYYAVGINEFGCEAQDSIEVILNANPPVDLGPDLVICDNTLDTLFADTQAPNVSWYFSTTSPSIEFAVATGYQLPCNINGPGYYIAETQTPGSDCRARDTILVEKNTSPVLTIPDAEFLCGTQSTLTLETVAQSGVDYEWFLAGTGDLGVNAPSLDVTTLGAYTLTATDQQGCSSSKTVNVSIVNTNFDLEFTIASTEQSLILDTLRVCENNTVTITAQPENTADFVLFSWFTNLNGSSIEDGSLLRVDDNIDRMYYVEFVHNTSQCISIDSFYIDFTERPIIDIADITVCDSNDATLDTELEGYIHEWTINGMLQQGETGSTLDVEVAGDYVVVAYENDVQCASVDEIAVTLTPGPVVGNIEDMSICSGETAEFNLAPESSDYQYVWLQDGVQIIGATDQNLTISEGGLYQVVVTTAENCIDTLSSTVIESFIDDLSLGDDIELCPGESITLAPISGTFTNYEWSTNETTESIVIEAQNVTSPQVTTYTLLVNNGDNCNRTDEIDVTTYGIITAVASADKVELCPGDSLQLKAEGGLYYAWNNPETLNDPAIPEPVAMPETSTTYIVQVFDNCDNNIGIDSVEVTVFPMAMVSAGGDTCAFADIPLILNATGGVMYDWDNKTLIQGEADIASPTILIDEETEFFVTITDEFGCAYLDSVNVCIKENAEALLDPISIITPNGDNKNDYLYFEGLESFPNNKLTIFNRWGNIVYSQTSYHNANPYWDGSNGSEFLPADTYYYILEFNGLVIKNSITITRD